MALVPVPSTDAVRKTKFERFPALRLAQALAKELRQAKFKVNVADVLRWTEKMPSARKGGGTRDPALLFPKLLLIGKVTRAKSHYHLLIDDVLTSGGHLQACAAVLRKNGAQVPLAICAGRTRQIAVEDPFATSTEELPEFEPP